MALGEVTGTVERESSFSDKVRDAIRAAKMGQTVKIAWSVDPEVSAKLMPLKAKRDGFMALLVAHREKTKVNGKPVNLTDAQQVALSNAIKQLDTDRIVIVRAAMNNEANKHRASAVAFAKSLPNTTIRVGTETSVDPKDCRFTFSVSRTLTSIEEADALLASFVPQEPAKA